MEKGEDMEICPRCGVEGYVSVEKRDNRYYIYIIHIDGRRRRRKCYIGPLEGYSYVEKLHNLSLDNLVNIDYYQVIVNAVSLWRRRINKKNVAEALEKINKLIDIFFMMRRELMEEMSND
ncbi:MAG: hypothetical protein QXQ91_04195 [Nanopusillaceae archaeon]